MKKLLVVWKSENEIDIEKFIVPYVYNSKEQNWFESVELLIWGASQAAIRDNLKYQNYIKTLHHVGISIYACKMCADETNATTTLEKLGVNVVYTGEYLSDKLKSIDWEVITL